MRVFALILALILPLIAPAQPVDPRAVGRATYEQATGTGLVPADFDPAQSAGLFVGINNFTDDSIVDLRFAADDAVDTAWFFVTAGLIPPDRVWLCISGEPTKPQSRTNRDALAAAGAKVKGGTYDDVYDALFDAKSAALAKGLLVLQFSSHGTSADPDAKATSDDLFLFTANTRKFDPKNRTIDLATIRRDLGSEGRARRTLILLDACREKFDAGRKSGDASSPLSQKVAEMMKGIHGTVTIFATKDKGYSFDGGVDPLTRQPIQNGVFIHYLLSELTTKRSANPQTGAVRVEELVRGVNTSVAGWVRAHPDATAAFREAGAEPGITYLPSGPEIMELPLAVDVEKNRAAAEEAKRVREAERLAAEAAQKAEAQRRLSEQAAAAALQERIKRARTNLGLAGAEDDAIIAIQPAVVQALNTWEGDRRERLLSALEKLDPSNEDSRIAFVDRRWKELAPTPTGTPVPTSISSSAATASITRPGTNPGDRAEISLPGGVKMAMRWIPAGSFTMGSPPSEADRSNDENQVQVRLSRGFWMAETEVTVAQFRAFVEATGYRTEAEQEGSAWALNLADGQWKSTEGRNWRNPGFEQSNNHPVTCVSWNDAKAFSDWAKVTLPTEAQWEYACRAGSKGAYQWGDDKSGGKGWINALDRTAKAQIKFSNNSTWPDDVLFPFEDGFAYTAPVGSLRANDWGLRDMHGNVGEWCADWYGGSLPGGTDPTGPSTGSRRVLRGASWLNSAQYCRSADRINFGPSYRDGGIGFRVALAVQ